MITIEKILLEFDPDMKNLLPALEKISAAFGFFGKEDMFKVAQYFSLPESKVYETASFYDLLALKKQPRLVIRICSSANCVVGESFKLISELERRFHVRAGDGFDQNVRIEEVSCFGRCGEGPIVEVNGKVYERVDMGKLEEILREWT